MVDKVAEATDTTVLIQGESGTGKELIADLIARRTAGRKDGPFVEINCASLPESLLESELFGYERGAFTDAKAQKRGLFEAADGGTLLLDEVGEMPIGTAGQAAEGARGADLPAARRHARSVGRRARHRRDQQGARRRGRARGPSGSTSTTAWTCSTSACRRCASGARTSCRWRRTSWRRFAARMRKPARARSRPRPSGCCSATTTRATSASCAT